ncbi:LOW QUALITY PROTEIN: galanin receptor type 1b [Cynoglossus semilaevis]|uniref:LOW QUALITY PROTEIN: galanin receptor type 1b n=1 Tax=Cynoglossus semilaevis TaxID=244447 RepID=UPI000D62F561|nr:LOW QUALITY PROTEIN: galanin receptor type 1-like [Cynoglossus semilaevis]
MLLLLLLLPQENLTSGWTEAEEDHRSPSGSESDTAAGTGLETGPEAVLVPLVFGLIFVLGVLGNCLVLLERYGSLGTRGGGGNGATRGSVTNIWIVNLSSADLGFLLFCVPFQASVYSLPHWLFGSFLCRFSHFCSSVSMLVSILTLVAMSVDRYLAVVRAGKAVRVRSRRNALVGVCVIWTLSVLFSVPVAQHQVLTGHTAAPNSTFCWESWSQHAHRRVYKVCVFVLGFVVPLLLISCCYVKILFHLHRKIKNTSKKSERSKQKTTQTVLMVVTAFALCWLPHHIIVMWVEFGLFPLNDASFVFRIVSHCLSYGHSCLNPVLYAFLSENFRKASRQVFDCHFLYSTPPPDAMVRFHIENFSTTLSDHGVTSRGSRTL